VPSKPDPDKDARLIKMWNQGLCAATIAARLGCSTASVRAMRIRLNLPIRDKVTT
jgi:hypothetical protein